MKPILQIEHMNISFTVKGATSHVVRDLSIDLCEGEILAIVGASGSGKTVFSHALMGILPSTATQTGTITYQGVPLNQKTCVEHFTLIPQTSSYLDPLMKIDQQISLKSNTLSNKSDNLYPFQCSGGMIRNALFSLAYEKEATVIIADEPTPGLDLDTAMETLTQLKALAQEGKSVILITHDIDLALHIANRVAVFYDGTVLEVAKAEDFTSGTLQHPYTRALFDALPQNGFTGYHFPRHVDNPATFCPNHQTAPLPVVCADHREQRNDPTLSCQGLGFRYPCKRVLFERVNFAIRQGQHICLFARSGFGKSTLAKVLSGYETPFAGQVLLDGKAVNHKDFSPVQLIYQHPERSVNPKWTMAQILAEGGAYDADLLHRFGIDDSFLNRFPHELSGGELQRICIVRAMKAGTRFLICDEITTMLDAITQANIWHSMVQEAGKRNIALLVITHNQALAHRICEQVVDFEQLCQET
ncbi:ATP-binding cassette domain-containing protein [Bengtsoniella intestinalis]|uniref:ABC transporter ATP-binding protein n=1 Tax=Bengtsoniella intestinalis TaxID=3073143 RepID=UPI00391EFB1D